MSRLRATLAAFFAFTGAMHFLRPRFFEAIVPPAIAAQKKEVVAISGYAELAGAAMVLHPASRRLGRWWLLANNSQFAIKLNVFVCRVSVF